MVADQQLRRAARRRARVLRRLVLGAIGAVALIALMSGVAVGIPHAVAAAQRPHPTVEPAAQPLDAETLMLAGSKDPHACVVTFQDDSGSSNSPDVLASDGSPYPELPILKQSGQLFAGWYTSTKAATALDASQRVNRGREVSCPTHYETLFAAWTTKQRAAAEKTSVPILMYHQFTTKPGGEDNSLRGNYTYVGDFDAQMNEIASRHEYYPSWPELEAFIDGTLMLPNRSIIVTDDDADPTWFQLGVPVVNKYKVLTTSFVITKWRSEGSPSPWVLQRSHTNDMHSAGDNGKGRMVNWSLDRVVADLETSARILGATEVLAYPFGQYNAVAEEALTQAGFDMGVTTQDGRVTPGATKLLLPRVRVNYGISLSEFKSMIS